MKIKVVQHSKYLGYSGTDKVAQLFYKYLDRTKFDPYILYRENVNDERKEIIESWYGKDYVIPYTWIPGNSGRIPPYWPEEENLSEILRELKPDILHIHHSGTEEWPLLKGVIPESCKIVTTNIFGEISCSYPINQRLYICDYIKRRALANGGKDGPVLNNPVEPRIWVSNDRTPFLQQYRLPNDAILLGRIGRPDNFDPIALKAFRVIETRYSNVYYLVVGACQAWKDLVIKLGLKRVIFIDKIVDDMELSQFLSALDIYAHCRHDGECESIALGEAQSHSLPIISHKSRIYNGHADTLKNCGIIVDIDDHVAYAANLMKFIEDKRLRSELGIAAYNKWLHTAEPKSIIKQLESIYENCIGD